MYTCFEFPSFLLRGFGAFKFQKIKTLTENIKLNLSATTNEIFIIPVLDKGIPEWYNL